VGPHDNLGQLPWWLTRIAKGGRVIAPGDPARGLQLTDVRDVSTFVLDRVEAQAGGIHNVVPDGPNAAMGQLVDNCVQATGSDATPMWMDEGSARARHPATRPRQREGAAGAGLVGVACE
jgi:2'-hydroxyisoflavone reductase